MSGDQRDIDTVGETQIGVNATVPVPVVRSDEATVRDGKGASLDAPTAVSRGVSAHDVLPAGTQIGRYLILERRGAGGMGIVYSAYDPKLDRRVALKLLRADDRGSALAGPRLLREAQLLAKLSHPNVVAVHDCGMFGDVVFVAMEFVEGVTLGEWSRGKPWEEILGAYLEAGRALAAVHGVGLIHRDFKPSNVIVDPTGRVRVLDFGIARAIEGSDLDGGTKTATPSEETTGVVVVGGSVAMPDLPETAQGTPPYMPPEQWRGDAIDARADQYAFAASLFKAFYDVAPIAAPTLEKMSSREARGPIAPRPSGTPVPLYVHRALTRALSYDKADRFASIEELLIALGRDPAARLRWRVGVALGVVVVASVAWLGVRHERGREARMCAAAADRMGGVWDAEQMRRVHDSLEASGKPSAEQAWTQTKARLDAYAGAWSTMRIETCHEEQRTAARAPHEQALGLRLVCLDRRLDELRSLTSLLATDPELVHRAVEAAEGLPPVADCALTSRGLSKPEDPDVLARVDAVHHQLAEADSRSLAGKYKAAKPIAAAAVSEARKTSVREVEAVALVTLGLVEDRDGDYASAASTLEDAVFAAEAAGDDRTFFTAARALAVVIGVRQVDFRNGARWERLATAALERLGSPLSETASLEQLRGQLANVRLDYPAALDHAQRAVDLNTRAHGPQHLSVALAEQGVAIALSHLTRRDEAMIHFERQRAILEVALGPAHPEYASVFINEAIIVRREGDPAGAIALERRSLAILEVALGREHPEVALVLGNMGIALLDTGHFDEAVASVERARTIWRRVLGDEHPRMASSLVTLARADRRQGRYGAARVKLEQAMRINEKASGRENPALTSALEGLFELSLREKKNEEALAYAERGLALKVKALGPDHPDTAVYSTDVARAQLALGKPERALPLLERALSMTRDKGDGDAHAVAQLAMARALRATSGDAARARTLVTEAAAHARTYGPLNNDALAEINAWSAENGRWLETGSR